MFYIYGMTLDASSASVLLCRWQELLSLGHTCCWRVVWRCNWENCGAYRSSLVQRVMWLVGCGKWGWRRSLTSRWTSFTRDWLCVVVGGAGGGVWPADGPHSHVIGVVSHHCRDSLVIHDLWWTVSGQVKAHVVLTCTNGLSPSHLPVTVANDRPWTTLSTHAH